MCSTKVTYLTIKPQFLSPSLTPVCATIASPRGETIFLGAVPAAAMFKQ